MGFPDNSTSAMRMDPLDIDADTVIYAFVNINADCTIDTSSLGEDWNNFLALSGTSKLVASFGGWEFSTSPDTYNIFRTCALPPYQNDFANVFVEFVYVYGLDGINIDWEYPGAPDIPGIPPDTNKNPTSGEPLLQLI